MQTLSLKILYPGYYRNFSCIGPDCPDHCCKDWRIEVDRKTYELYREMEDSNVDLQDGDLGCFDGQGTEREQKNSEVRSAPPFSGDLDKKIRLTDEASRTDLNYAEMILDKNKVCPFYDIDGLCKIQKTYGSAALCRTCSSYPRKANTGIGAYEGAVELTLNMSCPEAQRLALFNREPMRFYFEEMALKNNDPLLDMSLHTVKADDLIRPYVFDIRDCSIDILQARSLSVAERLFAVGMLLQNITEFADTGAYQKIPEILGIYRRSVEGETFSGALRNFAENDVITAMMQRTLIDSIKQIGDSYFHGGAAYRELTEVIFGWGKSGEDEVDYVKITEHANGLSDKYWKPFCDEKGYIIENYFVNLAFATVFPFQHAEALSPYGHFVIFAQQYATMRLLFLAAAEKYGAVSDDTVRGVITALNVATQHSTSAKDIAKAYIESGVGSIAHISFLLRN